jgi:putative FmdB family regulatory protein
MPTYDYRCEKCGNEFEDFYSIVNRAEPTESPCEKDVGVDESVVCGGKISQVLSPIPQGALLEPKLQPKWVNDKFEDIIGKDQEKRIIKERNADI